MKRVLTLIAVGLLICAFFSPATAQDGNAIAEGAKLWADNCTRCHNGRSSMERNDRDWTTIVLHMRARANLTRSEASAIEVYLRATNAPETTVQSAGLMRPAQPDDDVAAPPPVPSLTESELQDILEYLRKNGGVPLALIRAGSGGR